MPPLKPATRGEIEETSEVRSVATSNHRVARMNHEEQRRAMTAQHHDHRRVIAIDGPAAAGKTTVARELANSVGAILFDTGALYRSVTLAALRRGIASDDRDQLRVLARDLVIELRPPTVDDGRSVDVLLDGEDVTWDIRTPLVDAHVSDVSALPEVRSELLELQRSIASGRPVVMVGRDVGTVVTPGAGVKIYLDASVEERARRRIAELTARGVAFDAQSIIDDLKERDRIDSTRALSPLAVADDATHVNTDGKDVREVVAELKRIVAQAWAALGVAS
jgi:cytidylate kinase